MECEYFKICGSCKIFDDYETQVANKKAIIEHDFNQKEITVITSSEAHYRVRSEFRIYHLDGEISYAMHDINKRVLPINACPKVAAPIYDLMPQLLTSIKQDEILSHKLYGIEFVSSTHGMLVTFIYHKPLDENWSTLAKPLEHIHGIHIIGRSRKIKLVLSQDYVMESLVVNGDTYHYKLYDGSFIQPNV